MSKPDLTTTINDLVASAFNQLYLSCGQPDLTPGALIKRLSPEKREVLKQALAKNFDHEMVVKQFVSSKEYERRHR